MVVPDAPGDTSQTTLQERMAVQQTNNDDHQVERESPVRGRLVVAVECVRLVELALVVIELVLFVGREDDDVLAVLFELGHDRHVASQSRRP